MKAICFKENWKKKDELFEKSFSAEPDWKGKTIILEMKKEGDAAPDVCLNGAALAGKDCDGSVQFNLTGRISYSEDNLLQVKPAGEPAEADGAFEIPATIWTAGNPHILLDGVQIKPVPDAPDKREIRIYTSAPGEVELAIIGENKKVARCKANAVSVDTGVRMRSGAKFVVNFMNPLRSTESEPHEYVCRVCFGNDEAETTFRIE